MLTPTKLGVVDKFTSTYTGRAITAWLFDRRATGTYRSHRRLGRRLQRSSSTTGPHAQIDLTGRRGPPASCREDSAAEPHAKRSLPEEICKIDEVAASEPDERWDETATR